MDENIPKKITYPNESKNTEQNKKSGKSFKKKILLIMLAIVLITAAWYIARANQTLEKISIQEGTFLEKVLRLLPIDNSFILSLPIETSVFEEPDTIEKRVNFLILGMRGKDDPNGGLLTDSIIILSIRPYDSKVSMTSIPRDLFVFMPEKNESHKLNEAYEIGEKRSPGKGLGYVKSIISDIAGVPIHYATIINFQGYKDLVDSMGGIELNLEKPFVEAVPFEEGSISLPAGKQTINGKTALLYVRARMSSSDFDRSRRQAEVIKALQTKMFKTGIILNPYRLDKILSAVENNLKTDMNINEIELTIKMLTKLKDPQIKTKVVDNGPEKVLYSTFNNAGAFILLPTGGNYDKIHEIVRNAFN